MQWPKYVDVRCGEASLYEMSTVLSGTSILRCLATWLSAFDRRTPLSERTFLHVEQAFPSVVPPLKLKVEYAANVQEDRLKNIEKEVVAKMHGLLKIRPVIE